MLDLETIAGSTRRFRLRDNTMTNADIAKQVGCTFTPNAHARGIPASIFFRGGCPAAVRLNRDEVVVFYLFDFVAENFRQIAEPVFDAT